MSLEEDFTKIVEEHKAEIDAKVKEAIKALDEAVELAEKYGIPFSPSISFLSQTYTPESYYAKFSDLDSSTVYDIAEVYPGGEWGEAGWEHSAVC